VCVGECLEACGWVVVVCVYVGVCGVVVCVWGGGGWRGVVVGVCVCVRKLTIFDDFASNFCDPTSFSHFLNEKFLNIHIVSTHPAK
jgi:hypothetical protein